MQYVRQAGSVNTRLLVFVEPGKGIDGAVLWLCASMHPDV